MKIIKRNTLGILLNKPKTTVAGLRDLNQQQLRVLITVTPRYFQQYEHMLIKNLSVYKNR